MATLPRIQIGEHWCRLPLAEPTAQALLTVLLGPNDPQGTDNPQGDVALAEALSLDPALALWTACHYARANVGATEVPATIADLASWLVANLASIVLAQVRDTSTDALESAPAEAIKSGTLAQLAAADVAAARKSSGKHDPLTAPQYLATLVRNVPQQWLTPATAPAAGPAGRKKKASRPTARSAAQHVSGKVAAKKYPAGSPPEQARQQWLVPAGFAATNFLPLATQLARYNALQANFDERLETEKLEALAEFAAGAGHEINNPLAVISGRAQLFLRQEQDPERRRALAVINTQARRVHEMIADMMLFARPPQPQLADCDVAEVVDTITAELTPRAEAANVEIRVVCAADLPMIQADATQLQVAVRAVCENALDALAAGGRIEIAIESRDECSLIARGKVVRGAPPHPALYREGRVVNSRATSDVSKVTSKRAVAIRIRDNGPGMPPEVRRHAFDPYFSGRGAGRGLGNGLSKCWRIVTGHGGSIEIDSTPGGTSVTIVLPTENATTMQPQAAPSQDS